MFYSLGENSKKYLGGWNPPPPLARPRVKKVRGKGGRAWTLIRGNTVYSKTQAKADPCQRFNVYIRSTRIKVQPHPGQILRKLGYPHPVVIAITAAQKMIQGNRDTIWAEQFLHRLTSSCCLQGIQDGLDSGFHGDRFRILCELIFYFGFQSLAVFRNP